MIFSEIQNVNTDNDYGYLKYSIYRLKKHRLCGGFFYTVNQLPLALNFMWMVLNHIPANCIVS